MKKILGLIGIAALGLIFNSCSKNDDLMMDGLRTQSPYDTEWKLVEFGETTLNRFSVMTTNNTTSAILPDDANVYRITFKRDSTFTGYTSTNSISGKVSIVEKRGTLTFKNIISTEKAEIGDGAFYMENLPKVQHYEVIYRDREKFLRLFYPEDKKYYLEYKALPSK